MDGKEILKKAALENILVDITCFVKYFMLRGLMIVVNVVRPRFSIWRCKFSCKLRYQTRNMVVKRRRK